MIKILVVDDDPNKTKQIKSLLNEFPEIDEKEILSSSDLFTAKKIMSEKQFDLLILDLNLPERFGDEPEGDAGLKFLNEINLDDRLTTPFHIIGITAFSDLRDRYSKSFEENLWLIIQYEEEYNSWKEILKNKIIYLIKSKKELLEPTNKTFKYDIGIVTALYSPELEQILQLDYNWQEEKLKHDHVNYYKGSVTIASKKLKVVAAHADEMGMVASSVLCSKIIFNYCPRYLIMAGIAAGLKGKCNLGDLVIADPTWNYGSGKISNKKGESIFLPDPRQISLVPEIKTLFDSILSKRTYLDEIQRDWKYQEINNKLKAHLGPLASGSYVISDKSFIEGIKKSQRKLIGIDMETFSVFYSATHANNPRPTAISIKGVSDFADSNKNDNFRNYAAYVSASFIDKILRHELNTVS